MAFGYCQIHDNCRAADFFIQQDGQGSMVSVLFCIARCIVDPCSGTRIDKR